MNIADITNLLKNAKDKVVMLGIVPFDLEWEEIAEKWAEQLKVNLNFSITLLCESDNALFAQSLLCDRDKSENQRSFKTLQFIRDRALELTHHLGNTDIVLKQVDAQVLYLPIPLNLLQIDGQFFTSPVLHEMANTHIEEICNTDPQYQYIQSYLTAYLDTEGGRKYSAKSGDEVLELFDHERTPRGIYPRKSFYDTDFSQLVVWGLIFDRKGRLLIHRRADNAKDNQSMWDKSVGGHVDFSKDVETSRAVARELIEELFEDESKHAGGFKPLTVTDEGMVYLGEWRPKQRGRYPFREISGYKDEWTYFRLHDSQQVYSPRTLPKPEGKIRRLRVIADVFIFVAGPSMNEALLGTLRNSKYKLLELSELKSAMNTALRKEAVPHFDEKLTIPEFTPDLINIMTGGLRDTLEEFAQNIKRYVK